MKRTGSCHCGKVRYEVNMEITKALSCNCSICQRKGTLLAFTPNENFKLLSGEETLKDYQFGKKRIHHYFCTNCGVTSFSEAKGPDGKDMKAINVRCIEDIDLDSLHIDHFDGRKL